jgi:hypothetical protein
VVLWADVASRRGALGAAGRVSGSRERGRRRDASCIELRWRLVGRDAAGHLVATTVLPCGRATTTQRNRYLTLTPAGLVSRSARVPVAKADEPSA